MGALSSLARRSITRSSGFPESSLQDLLANLPAGALFTQTLQPRIEQIENDFPGFVSGAYKSNPAIFALEAIRMLGFSEARLKFRQQHNGKPGDLFGTPELAIFEEPWPGATTGDLLARLLLFADFGGTGFAVRRPGPRIKVPRPDWMTLIIGSTSPDAAEADLWDIDAEIVGLQYWPGGIGVGKPVNLLPESVGIFAPIPDPIARFRGMSWITPLVREIESHSAATNYKLAYFRNGATVNLAVNFNTPLIKTPQDMREWIELFEEEHKGATQAFNTLFLTAGMDAKPIGTNLDDSAFAPVQEQSEAMMASAASVPVELVGFKAGKQGSSLQSGTYKEAKRRLADLTYRPLWRNVAGSLARLVTVPPGSELWYDDSDIPFLAEDKKDAADVLAIQATAINTFITAGMKPDAAIDAVISNDLSRLTGQHTGLYSVQLQPPLPNGPPPSDTAQLPGSTNGTKPLVPTTRAEGSEVRCSGCDKLLAEQATPPYRFTCPRCHAAVAA